MAWFSHAEWTESGHSAVDLNSDMADTIFIHVHSITVNTSINTDPHINR